MKNGLIDRVKVVFSEMTRKNRFDKLDFVLLKTTLMLAAVDGEIAEAEIGQFRDFAAKCCGYCSEAFETLWDAAVRSAGYLFLLSRFLGRDELVAAFLKEAERDFVDTIVLETSAERLRAFELMDQMAMADGDYSEIERDCIVALVKKVKAAREKSLARRYPHAAKFDRSSGSRK